MSEGNKKLQLKSSVRVATSVNTIANLAQAPLIIDSITLNVGDRVLVKDGASKDGIEPVSNIRNGIYSVLKITVSGVQLKRSIDANKDKEVTAGMFTFVQEGSVNKDSGWVLITDNPIALGVTALEFLKFTSSGELSNDIQKRIDTNTDNTTLNAFRIATQHSLTLSNMVNGIVDEYEDEDNIDNAASIDEIYDSVEDLYKTQGTDAKLLLNLNGADGQTTTVDSSASGHSVSFNGNAALDTASKKFGTASVELPSSGGSLQVPDSIDFDIHGSITTDYTVHLWFKLDNLTRNTQIFMIQREDSANRWIMSHNTNKATSTDNGIQWFYSSDGSTELIMNGPGKITDNNFHHAAMVKKGSEYGLYLDGVQVGYGTTTKVDTFAADVFIGADPSSTTSNLDGNIDEVIMAEKNLFNASPNAGLTDTITVPVSESAGAVVNTTLISEAFTAVSQPNDARIVIFHEEIDTVTLNTDIKAFASRDNGVTYSEITLANIGAYEGSKNMLAGTVDISSQPSGTSMRYKIETFNLKNQNIHGSGLAWG